MSYFSTALGINENQMPQQVPSLVIIRSTMTQTSSGICICLSQLKKHNRKKEGNVVMFSIRYVISIWDGGQDYLYTRGTNNTSCHSAVRTLSIPKTTSSSDLVSCHLNKNLSSYTPDGAMIPNHWINRCNQNHALRLNTEGNRLPGILKRRRNKKTLALWEVIHFMHICYLF